MCVCAGDAASLTVQCFLHFSRGGTTLNVGLDIGSTTIKCVVLDRNDQILYSTYERHFSHIVAKAEVISELDDYEDYLSKMLSFIKIYYDIDEIEWIKKRRN